MSLGDAADVFTKLSVGDGLVSQIPALIVSLAAGLLVSKGGTRGSAEQAVLGQLGNYPRALLFAALLMFVLAMPGLPLLPSRARRVMAFVGYAIPKRRGGAAARKRRARPTRRGRPAAEARESVKESLKTAEIELCLGKQLAGVHPGLARRVGAPGRQDAAQVRPAVRLRGPRDQAHRQSGHPAEELPDPHPRHGRRDQELRLGEVLVVMGDGRRPDVPGEEVREPPSA